jgi:hypothetical protein
MATAVAGMAALSRPAPAATVGKNATPTPLPVKEMESILGASGTVTNGVLSVEIDRTDLTATLPGNISAESELNGTLYFQPLPNGRALLNGDFCLKPEETNPFIDALMANHIKVQAFHQHLFDLTPMVWFVHFRLNAEPRALAHAVRKAMDVTAVVLPQSPPSSKTPFDAKRLASILGGSAEVGSKGAVTVSIPRKETITILGVRVQPEAGISTTVDFQPLNSNGSNALVVPDFALIGTEVNPVFETMRREKFINGCLYNQETDELPQLYFSHQWATGNPYVLAQKVRKALNLTNSMFMST